MHQKEAEKRFRNLLKKYDDYEPEAYQLIYETLDYTFKYITKSKNNKHVTAQELLEGFRLYSINKFGLLAKVVMDKLRIRNTNDIGKIVFYLIDYELLGKQKSDKQKDYNNVYDFNKVFNLKPIIAYNSDTSKWNVTYQSVS